MEHRKQGEQIWIGDICWFIEYLECKSWYCKQYNGITADRKILKAIGYGDKI